MVQVTYYLNVETTSAVNLFFMHCNTVQSIGVSYRRLRLRWPGRCHCHRAYDHCVPALLRRQRVQAPPQRPSRWRLPCCCWCPMESRNPVKMLITDTRVGRNTKALVAGVSERASRHPDAIYGFCLPCSELY